MRAMRINVLVFLLSITALAQGAPKQADAAEWTRIDGPSGDFSISLPSTGYLVDNEDNLFRLYYIKDGMTITIAMEKKNWAKQELKGNAALIKDKTKYKFFDSGDFLVEQYNGNDGDEGHSYMWLALASSKGRYTVSVNSKTGQSVEYSRVLRSILLNQKPLFVRDSTYPLENTTVQISSLKTDDIILQALKQPAPKQSKFAVQTIIEDERGDKRVFSRDLLILRKPRAAYTDSARERNVNGSVSIRVTFLANGQIGPIELLTSLDRGLDRSAFEAAKKIKFLAAEVDGKPVDVKRIIEYGFNIY